MDSGIKELQNARAHLVPLAGANYRLLREVARDPELIRYSPGILHTQEGFEAYFGKALAEMRQGISLVFLILDRKTGQYAGSTRFMRMDPANQVLEIGATWIAKSFWGTGLNGAVKELLLAEAFGQMGYERVEFRIDERNLRSRKAVEKLGARLEGILRSNVYLSDGFKRNTCVYGLLREEWADSRTGQFG
ncbi:GNAT family N-acetyltransferase [Robiginitalea sp. SC105]|uniref:GNAT family N-acetyltransferase n=1 Tax=Robiginitalea sp. SC105 TaxID=2762332 RepID=UPI00163AA682|nr:GNAT family protein [Robiginitalea sp. SC105]MBC2840715.1 GNAT family N-acetyltransferase [Robiginitalea sp. SC105]